MRALSSTFLDDLNPETGKYGELVKRVHQDKDLDLELRGDYINIYYQGHNVLKLKQNGSISIDKAFTEDGIHKLQGNISDVTEYLKLLPYIKDNVSCHSTSDEAGTAVSKQNREMEFEQLLIRANNRESRNNSDYIIIDRQYVTRTDNRTDRWDLVALRYAAKGKPKGNLSIIEVKYAQNPDIQDIRDQVERYGQYLKVNLNVICDDMNRVLQQKLDLGLITRTKERIGWLNELCLNQAIDQRIETTEIIVYLIDYNPKAKLKTRALALGVPQFGGKVRLAHGGLALWQSNLSDFGDGI